MATISRLDVAIGVHTSELAAGMNRARRIVQTSLGSITRMFTGVRLIMPLAGAGAAVGGIAMIGKSAVTLAGDLEQARIAFTTMLGSAKNADAFLRDMAQFAAKTPFRFDDVRTAAQRFLAFGFEANQVVPILTAVGNAAAALGGTSELINRIALALGQMRAKGKVSGEEMRQLAEAGIPAWEILANTIGVTIPEAMKLAERGAIDVNVALDGFIRGMNEKFPGMMAKQSKTLLGLWSTLRDEISLTLTAIGQKIITTFDLKGVLDSMVKWMGAFRETLEKSGLRSALEKALGADLADSLMRMFETFKTSTLPMLGQLAKKLIDIGITAAPHLLNALNWILEMIPKIAEFLSRLPAYAKVAFTAIEVHIARIGMKINRMAAEFISAFDAIPFVDLSNSVKRLDTEFVALSLAAAEATGEHKTALIELQKMIDAQEAAARRVRETAPEIADEAAEGARESIIRITRGLGEAIEGQLRGGFGRGGQEGTDAIRAHITSLREWAAANPIVIPVKYQELSFTGGRVTAPAG